MKSFKMASGQYHFEIYIYNSSHKSYFLKIFTGRFLCSRIEPVTISLLRGGGKFKSFNFRCKEIPLSYEYAMREFPKYCAVLIFSQQS